VDLVHCHTALAAKKIPTKYNIASSGLQHWESAIRCKNVTLGFFFRVGGSKGQFHTRAKSRDHEIVRAQRKVVKGRPKTPPNSCSVVTDLQV
jgi:hypothetical protein